MPIEYKVYGCQFKCGWRHNKSINIIKEHEENCWHHPKNRTCITCKHGELVTEPSFEVHEGRTVEGCQYRECAISDIDFDGIKPIIKCNEWESKWG